MPRRGSSAIWSPEARADLDQIWTHYEQVAGRKTAEKLVREIDAVVATIEEHPYAGRDRNELRRGVARSRQDRMSCSIGS